MEKSITKSEALSKIRCVIKTIKYEIARLGKSDEWLDDFNHRVELNDILYGLRDIIYINTIGRRACRQKQIRIYSIQDVINKFIEYKDPFCVCPIEEDVIDSIIYTLQQVDKYFENKSLLAISIENTKPEIYNICKEAIKDLSSYDYSTNAITFTKVIGSKAYKDFNRLRSIYPIQLNEKTKAIDELYKKVFAHFKNEQALLDKITCVKKTMLEDTEPSEDTELSEDDELY